MPGVLGPEVPMGLMVVWDLLGSMDARVQEALRVRLVKRDQAET